METLTEAPSDTDQNSPHSLGKLIEWKLVRDDFLVGEIKTPHSLGKLIEWKPESNEAFLTGSI